MEVVVGKLVCRDSFSRFVVLAFAALISMAFGLSACGGSSSSLAPKPKPTPTGTPVATATPTVTPTQSPTATPAASWNLYNNFRAYYAVPYASPTPQFGTPGFANPQINIQIAVPGGSSIALSPTLDTGSRGMWITSDHFAANFPPSAQATPGYIFYWSSGRQVLGNWTSLAVTFPDAQAVDGASSPAVATVPVLITNQVCDLKGNWPNGTRSVTTCSIPPSNSMMGIGFDRTGYGTCPEVQPPPTPTDPYTPVCPADLPAANQNYNAMLNLAEMQSGQMVSGYILTPDAVVLGLTPANTAAVTSSSLDT
ncbi:MAG: hypothetical protein ACYDC3_09740 [Candidatus Binataceae bacterium]